LRQLLVTHWHRQFFFLTVCLGTTISLLGSWLYVAYSVRLHEGKIHQMIPIRVAEGVSGRSITSL
jgi:hypothetical protein